MKRPVSRVSRCVRRIDFPATTKRILSPSHSQSWDKRRCSAIDEVAWKMKDLVYRQTRQVLRKKNTDENECCLGQTQFSSSEITHRIIFAEVYCKRHGIEHGIEHKSHMMAAYRSLSNITNYPTVRRGTSSEIGRRNPTNSGS